MNAVYFVAGIVAIVAGLAAWSINRFIVERAWWYEWACAGVILFGVALIAFSSGCID